MRNQHYLLLALAMSTLLVAGCAAITPPLARGGPADPDAMETPFVPVSTTLQSYQGFSAEPNAALPKKQPSASPPAMQMKNMPGMDMPGMEMPGMNKDTMPGMDHGAPK